MSNLQDLRVSVDFLRAAKGMNATVGFAGGVFDMLHPGHIYFISKAKELCDILIVGLTPDSRVKKIKGSERPIFNQDLRAYAVANLETVDVVFHQPYDHEGNMDFETFDRLCEAINANIAFFGSDYNDGNLPPHRKKYAKEIAFISRDFGVHTTDIIRKITQSTKPSPT